MDNSSPFVQRNEQIGLLFSFFQIVPLVADSRLPHGQDGSAKVDVVMRSVKEKERKEDEGDDKKDGRLMRTEKAHNQGSEQGKEGDEAQSDDGRLLAVLMGAQDAFELFGHIIPPMRKDEGYAFQM